MFIALWIAFLFLLVVARMAGLVRQEGRVVSRERALRGAGIDLVAAASHDQVCEAAIAGVRRLLGDDQSVRLALVGNDDAEVVASSDGSGWQLDDSTADWLSQTQVGSLHTSYDAVPAFVRAELRLFAGDTVLVVPLSIRSEVRPMLVVCSPTSVQPALVDSLGPLTPDADGFAMLRDWLGRFADLHRHYGPVIKAWTEAEIDTSEFGRMGASVLGDFVIKLGQRIAKSSAVVADPQLAALALVAMIERSNYYAIYLQDNWKVTPNLTLDYGLRWEYDQPFYDKFDKIVNIDFVWDNSHEPVFVRTGTGDPYEGNPPFHLASDIPYVRDGRFGNGAYKSDFNDLAPRLGVAWSLGPKTVIRGGGGIYYVRDIGNAVFDTVRNAPFTIRRNEPAESFRPNLSFDQPFVRVCAPGTQ